MDLYDTPLQVYGPPMHLTLKKLHLCSKTPFNQVHLLKDTATTILIDLMGERWEMTIVTSVPWPCLIWRYNPNARRESFPYEGLNEVYL